MTVEGTVPDPYISINHDWEMAAARLGLEARVYARGKRPPFMTGVIRGFDVAVRSKIHRAGGEYQETNYSILVTVRLEPIGVDLRATRKGPSGWTVPSVGGVRDALRAKQCKLGDGWLDKHVTIRTSNPHQVAAFFASPGRVEALRNLFTHVPTAVLSDQSIEWKAGGDLSKLESKLPQLIDAAERLTR